MTFKQAPWTKLVIQRLSFDSKARVISVQGLCVLGAIAFPILPPGHPSAVICKFRTFPC